MFRIKKDSCMLYKYNIDENGKRTRIPSESGGYAEVEHTFNKYEVKRIITEKELKHLLTTELTRIGETAENIAKHIEKLETTIFAQATCTKVSISGDVSYQNENMIEQRIYSFVIEKFEDKIIYTPTDKTVKNKPRRFPYGRDKLHGEHVANIDFDKGIISATDPCYNMEVWCRKDNIEISPGEYQVNTFTSDDGRVRILQIILKDENVVNEFNNTNININKSWRTLSENIGVDAGICGFFQCKPDFDDDDWDDFCQDIHYDGSGNLWEGKNSWEKGFFTESGYGDGCYSVHAIRRKVGPANKYGIIALELRF